jgi:hypothetical protein
MLSQYLLRRLRRGDCDELREEAMSRVLQQLHACVQLVAAARHI